MVDCWSAQRTDVLHPVPLHDLSASLLLESSCSSEDTTASGNLLEERSYRKELSYKRGEFKREPTGCHCHNFLGIYGEETEE